MLQQTHLSTTASGKQNLHALQQQQHQLIAQIQLTQQALMLGKNMDGGGNGNSPAATDLLLKESGHSLKKERERHASETTLASSEGSLKENRSENIVKHVNGDSKAHSPVGAECSIVEKLFDRGHCSWPGCDTGLPDSAAFFRHLSSQHTLDDKSTVSLYCKLKIHRNNLEILNSGANTSPVANCKSTRIATHQGERSFARNDETFAA